jgi:hypothetical protein
LIKYEPEQEPINTDLEDDFFCTQPPYLADEKHSFKSSPGPSTDKYESIDSNISNECNIFSDLDEELNVYTKPDLFPDLKPADSWMWGSTNDQAVWMMSTIYDTNVFNYSGAIYLVVIRSSFFAVIALVVYEDVQARHGLSLEKYSVWGELATLATLFFLVLCSIQKYVRELYYESQQYSEHNTLTNKPLHIQYTTLLYRSASMLFQFAYLSELSLTLLFWSYHFAFQEEFSWKLFAKELTAPQNMNHSLPVVVLTCEFMINNIPFSCRFLALSLFLNTAYMLYNIYYNL